MSKYDQHVVARFNILPGHIEYIQVDVISSDQLAPWLEVEAACTGHTDNPKVDDFLYGVGIEDDNGLGFLWFPLPEHAYDFRVHEGVLYSLVHLSGHKRDDYATWLHPTLNLVTRAVPGIHGVSPEVMRTLIGAGVLCAMCGTEESAVQSTNEHITNNISPTQFIGM